MILTVTCNPALDTTYVVDGLVTEGVNRVESVTVVPGGKGVNVSRVLAQMGEPTMVTGLADGYFGPHLEDHGPGHTDLSVDFVEALDLIRRTVVVHDRSGGTTSLWEPGYPAPEWAEAALIDKVSGLLTCAHALVVSGSLAPGLPADLPARLAEVATAAGVPTLLDVDGDPLRCGAQTEAVVMPNEEEFRRLIGNQGPVDVVGAVRGMGRSAPTVVTLGGRGMVVVDADDAWHAEPLSALSGNPTGAGDSAAAAVALGLARGWDWPRTLREAVAVSAAAVLTPTAGSYDVDTYAAWRDAVPVTSINTFEI